MMINHVIYDESNLPPDDKKLMVMMKQSRMKLIPIRNQMLKTIMMKKINQVMQNLILTKISVAMLLLEMRMLKLTPMTYITMMTKMQQRNSRAINLVWMRTWG